MAQKFKALTDKHIEQADNINLFHFLKQGKQAKE
jgi:hypothetical protein